MQKDTDLPLSDTSYSLFSMEGLPLCPKTIILDLNNNLVKTLRDNKKKGYRLTIKGCNKH